MDSRFMLKWNNSILDSREAQKITGGVADSGECGSLTGTFSCTTHYYYNDMETFSSTGLVCASHWRRATESVYVEIGNQIRGTGIDIHVTCVGAN